MHHIPLFSTITLFTEVIITALLLYIFYRAYKFSQFLYGLTAGVLAYEILFNISYMSGRVHDQTSHLLSKWYVALAIFHGTFSLLMFLLLLVFMGFAWRGYKRGDNFFQNHKKLMWTFLCCWLVAVFTGILFYCVSYLR